MASYDDLSTFRTSPEGTIVRNRVTEATKIKAQKLVALATPSQAQLDWAAEALLDPESKSGGLFNYVIAKNNTSTTQGILDADDGTVQSNVDEAVDKLITGGA